MSQPSRISSRDVYIWSVDESKQSKSCFRNKFYIAFVQASKRGKKGIQAQTAPTLSPRKISVATSD